MSDAAAPSQDFPVVIAVGASAGGVEALSRLCSHLPADFPAPVLVVLHVAPAGTSVLPAILGRRSDLTVSAAVDGEPLRAGHVYVAPPDQHLVLRDGHTELTREPRENGHRPAVDPTFRSVASAWGARAVGVILSGTRDDGSRGLAAIKAAGGTALVQDPDECLYRGMPNNAIRAVDVDGVLPIRALAARLCELAEDAPDAAPEPVGAVDSATELTATRFTCPDCGGVLFEDNENGAETYRCSVGHAYSPESLEDEQARLLESALWAAVRSLEDRAILLRRLAARAAERGEDLSQDVLERQAADAGERANLIRAIVARPIEPSADAG